MYYIYEIPGVKIGCTKDLEMRVKLNEVLNDNRHEYENAIILEMHEDIYVASERERVLQSAYGYPVDPEPYYITKDKLLKMSSVGGLSSGKDAVVTGRIRKWQVAGGKARGHIQGAKNKESGLISNLGKQNAEKNNQPQTCQHCGCQTRGVGFHRWHGNNCKHNKNK